MRDFLNNNKKYSGIGFNLIIRNTNQIFEKFKRSKIFQLLGVYDYSEGSDNFRLAYKSNNLKKDTDVEWLPTQAVIYKYNIIKKKV